MAYGKRQNSEIRSGNAGPEQDKRGVVSSKAGYWPEIAKLWEQIGPPLRPSDQDISFCSDTIGTWVRDNGAPRALVLGVTPELYRLPWPEGTDILAVDHTPGMIDTVWPGPRNSAICADWSSIPLQPGSRDIVLCDGGFHLLAYPNKQRELVKMLHRIIAPGGLCIFRLFVPPSQREKADRVIQDLLGGRIPNLNLLKLRLGMALMEDVNQGIRLSRVWDAIHKVAPDFNSLAESIGWPIEHLLAINAYRDCPTRYYFLSLTDARQMFSHRPGGFDFHTVMVPTYELGEQCPTIVFQRSGNLENQENR